MFTDSTSSHDSDDSDSTSSLMDLDMDLSEWCDICKIRYNESTIDHEASNQHQRAFDEAYKKLEKKEKEDKKPGMCNNLYLYLYGK